MPGAISRKAFAAFMFWPAAAMAQTGPSEQIKDIPAKAEPAAKVVGGKDLLIVPIPQSSPTLGTGLTLAAVMFYNPNNAPSPWISGVGAMRTSNKSWAVGAFHNMSLANDKFRATAFAGYADINVKFYGIGPEAGDRGVSIDIEDKGFAVMLQGQIRIAKHLYAGGRFEFLDLKTSILNRDPLFPDLDIPEFQLDSKMSAIGPSLTYDRRDSSLNPRDGEMMSILWLLNNSAWGSDYSYNKVTAYANIYRPLGKNTVIAGRAALCGVSTGGPFYDLCLYGQSSDLRGYSTGRYRDRASWAGQVELRQKLFGRFGGAVFAGVGGVSPSISELTDTKFLPAAGAGLRYQPSKKTNINLRLDYAVGKDSHGLYFSIGEAF